MFPGFCRLAYELLCREAVKASSKGAGLELGGVAPTTALPLPDRACSCTGPQVHLLLNEEIGPDDLQGPFLL